MPTRALARELADYVTPSDRDDLAALVAASGPSGTEVATILRRQDQVRLFRAG